MAHIYQASKYYCNDCLKQYQVGHGWRHTICAFSKTAAHIFVATAVMANRKISAVQLRWNFLRIAPIAFIRAKTYRSYAKTDEEDTIDENYLMSGNTIAVKTLDLNQEFSLIKARLDSIADEYL